MAKNFGPNFRLFDPNLGTKNFLVGFTFTSSLGLLQAMIVCNFKEN